MVGASSNFVAHCHLEVFLKGFRNLKQYYLGLRNPGQKDKTCPNLKPACFVNNTLMWNLCCRNIYGAQKWLPKTDGTCKE